MFIFSIKSIGTAIDDMQLLVKKYAYEGCLTVYRIYLGCIGKE